MAKNDIGYYVRICDLSDSTLPTSYTGQTYAYFNTVTGEDDTSVTSEITQGHPWDGPYQVFQENSVFSTSRGSLPTDETGTWNLNATDLYGTPLDPWGHPYIVAYNSTDKIMIIYSAGPDGKIQTNAGSKQIPANSDDIVYVFR
ncbi:MAG: type II secretion system protein GspG [Candidatus Omnitrophica bacterium]|nr:type II secretion system protein GspG [Candidatus Omnitrophota bacterium]